jgi:hypothetical protein
MVLSYTADSRRARNCHKRRRRARRRWHRDAGRREPSRDDAPHCHAGHWAGYLARWHLELPGVSYNVHTYSAHIYTCSCTVKVTLACSTSSAFGGCATLAGALSCCRWYNGTCHVEEIRGPYSTMRSTMPEHHHADSDSHRTMEPVLSLSWFWIW